MSKNNVGVSLSALLSTISKSDIAVSFGFGCVALYCRSFLWTVLCPFFARGFDNVEKRCCCFVLYLALLHVNVFSLYCPGLLSSPMPCFFLYDFIGNELDETADALITGSTCISRTGPLPDLRFSLLLLRGPPLLALGSEVRRAGWNFWIGLGIRLDFFEDCCPAGRHKRSERLSQAGAALTSLGTSALGVLPTIPRCMQCSTMAIQHRLIHRCIKKGQEFLGSVEVSLGGRIHRVSEHPHNHAIFFLALKGAMIFQIGGHTDPRPHQLLFGPQAHS